MSRIVWIALCLGLATGSVNAQVAPDLEGFWRGRTYFSFDPYPQAVAWEFEVDSSGTIVSGTYDLLDDFTYGDLDEPTVFSVLADGVSTVEFAALDQMVPHLVAMGESGELAMGNSVFHPTGATKVLAAFVPVLESGYALSDLAGDWRVFHWGVGFDPYWIRGEMSLNSDGLVTGGELRRPYGVYEFFSGGAHSLSPDGTISGNWEFAPYPDIEFEELQLNANKDLVIGLSRDFPRHFACWVKESTGFVPSDIAGVWRIAGYNRELPPTSSPPAIFNGTVHVASTGQVIGGSLVHQTWTTIDDEVTGGTLEVDQTGRVSGVIELGYTQTITLTEYQMTESRECIVGVGTSPDNSPFGLILRSEFLQMFRVPSVVFTRGDSNHDGSVDVSDAVFTLATLFVPGQGLPPCEDALDVNDDAVIDISDAIYSLAHLFLSGSPVPPDPFPSCGVDTTTDVLWCFTYDCP